MQTYYLPKSVGRVMRRSRTRGTQVASLAEQIEAKLSSIARAEAEAEKMRRTGNPALIQSAEHILAQMQEGLATLRRMQAEADAATAVVETEARELLDTPHFEEPIRALDLAH